MHDDILTKAIPDAPAPSAEARARAIRAGMAAFENNPKAPKGNVVDMRPKDRKGMAPVHKSGEPAVMKTSKSTYMKVAACLLVSAAAIPLAINSGMLTKSSGLGGVHISENTGFGDVHHLPQARRALPETGNATSQADRERVADAARGGTTSTPTRNSIEPQQIERQESGKAIPETRASQNPVAATHPAAPVGVAQSPLAAAPAPYAAMREMSAQAPQFAPGSPIPSVRGNPDAIVQAPQEPTGRDVFASQEDSPFKAVAQSPVSTFSLDVDTASYSFARASLARNAMPQKASVRVEEMINYFPYAYPAPNSPNEPFKTTISVFPSPWNAGRQIVHVGIKGYEVAQAERPVANLVFLVDTSGSMSPTNRLPLAKQALTLLVEQLRPGDKVSIVTYAGSSTVALDPTDVSDKRKILAAIDRLGAGGSTAGAQGIATAYSLAHANFDAKGVNRIMLVTDGDFNVGVTNRDELKGYVERERGKGVYLSVLGFGMGNYNDAMMQALAQNGNGVAAYIDTLSEARKVLVEEATSSIVPIAGDVKIQVEFNPAKVAEYRLVGYETRALRREDFNNDKVDAGDVGSGHTVTALYEIVPVGAPKVNPDLRYAAPASETKPATNADELGFLAMRYKLPGQTESHLATTPIPATGAAETFEAAPQEARFAVAAAGFGELLRGGRHVGTLTYDDVIRQGLAARGEDPFGYRSEFVQLVRSAKALSSIQPR